MEKINTPGQFRTESKKLETLGDMGDFLKKVNYDLLMTYIDAIENAERFTEQTMRDRCILSSAKMYWEQIVNLHGVQALLHKDKTVDELLMMDPLST